jgi:hypothetical protein
VVEKIGDTHNSKGRGEANEDPAQGGQSVGNPVQCSIRMGFVTGSETTVGSVPESVVMIEAPSCPEHRIQETRLYDALRRSFNLRQVNPPIGG